MYGADKITSISFEQAGTAIIVHTVPEFASPVFSAWPYSGPSIVGDAVSAWLAAGHTPTPYSTPTPTVDDVVKERERRLALGFSYTFPNSDARGTIRVGTDDSARKGWEAVTKWKDIRLQKNDTTTTMTIVDENGKVVQVTATDWLNILDFWSTDFENPLWQASFQLEGTNPIPTDYASDAHWPAVQ